MPAVLQSDTSAFRWERIDTTAVPPLDSHTFAPTDGNPDDPNVGGTPPDFIMSPRTVSEMPTTGLLLMLKVPSAGSAIANAGGFSVIVYIRDPHTYGWASMAAITIDYSQLFVTFDFDAAELYFQIDPASILVGGKIDIGIAEQ